MTARAPARRLSVGATVNLRDVGGYPVRGGGRTRWGRLLRSDAARFGGPDHAGLAALGLRTVVDLRDDVERDALDTGLDEVVPRVLHRPLDPRPLLPGTPRGAMRLGALYVALVRERGARIAAIVRELAEPGALPALVHCAAGKDRTGVVIALVLGAVGVPDDVVVADYALTADYLTAEFFAGLPRLSGATDPDDATLRSADPASMAAMVSSVTDSHGSSRSYLLDHGVPSEAIDRLRAALST